MPQGSTQFQRTNNNPITEMYMALFEQSLAEDSLVHVDLSMEEMEGTWMYKNMTTSTMYDLFIAGHRQANEDMCRMGEETTTFQEMWEMSGKLVDHYINKFQTP